MATTAKTLPLQGRSLQYQQILLNLEENIRRPPQPIHDILVEDLDPVHLPLLVILHDAPLQFIEEVSLHLLKDSLGRQAVVDGHLCLQPAGQAWSLRDDFVEKPLVLLQRGSAPFRVVPIYYWPIVSRSLVGVDIY